VAAAGAIGVRRKISSVGPGATARPTRSGAIKIATDATRRISNSSKGACLALRDHGAGVHDRTFAGEIVRNLQDEGLSLAEFGQGFLSMGPASTEFLRLLIGREVQHGGNPIGSVTLRN
jgi:hypothetical protein